ncbi:hypothetical protein ACLBKU_08750 [Erythrobacter sp. NE805]|uniref:hypothetical protein n=1 Tax=Erythrobacter sp. NE805 TaxID=3389875 RepID=UPI00396B1404
MKSILPRSGALVAAVLFAAAAHAAQTAPADTPAPSATEQPAADPAADKAEAAATGEAKAEDRQICRYIKADASSRRKTKVCRTAEEWRELNNIR